MKLTKVICTLAAIALFGAVFGGCAKVEKKLTKVSVSEVTHSIFYAPQYVALNLGFFEEEGLEIDFSTGEGADKVMAAVLSHSVDIGFAGPEASIYVYNEGKSDYCKVFAQLTQRDGAFLLGREKDLDFRWEKLKGKTILPGRKGGVPYMALEHVLKSKGMVPGKDLEFDDSVQYANLAGAFIGGTGDYVALFEPAASTLETNGSGYILAAIGSEAGELPYTAYFSHASFIEKNKDTIQKFVNAVYKGQKWVEEHTAEEIAKAIAPSFPDSDGGILVKVINNYKDIGAWCTSPAMKEQAFNNLQDIMEEAGQLTKRVPFNDLIDNSFARKAAK